MTPKQRYLFDITGYLHLENVITGDALAEASEAVDRYLTTPADELPAGFEQRGLHQHGFAFDKSLECLTMHAATMADYQGVDGQSTAIWQRFTEAGQA